MIRNQNRQKPAKTILRDASLAIVRTPLLWFFSVANILTYNYFFLVQNAPDWLGCLYFLLIPIGVLATAGQIRSVQLQYNNVTESLSQIISFGTRRIGALIVVLLASGLLALILLGIFACPASLFLEQESKSNMWTPITNLSTVIVYPITVFAQCAIVISNLPIKSSLIMFFRVLKKDIFTILAIVIVFGVFRFIIATIYPTVVFNSIRIAGYMLVLLILEGVQVAFFTIAYIHYLVKESTTIQPVLSPQLTDNQEYKTDLHQQKDPPYQETTLLETKENLLKTQSLKQQAVQSPSWKKRDFIQDLIISAVFLALGYFTAQFVIANLLSAQANQQIIDFLSPELYQSWIKEVGFQLICGLPCALSIIIPILVVLSTKLNQLARSNPKILSITYAILGFIFGIFFYIPIQIFMALMLAIGGYETHHSSHRVDEYWMAVVIAFMKAK